MRSKRAVKNALIPNGHDLPHRRPASNKAKKKGRHQRKTTPAEGAALMNVLNDFGRGWLFSRISGKDDVPQKHRPADCGGCKGKEHRAACGVLGVL